MNKASNTIVFGKTGCGKTVKVRNLIKAENRVLIFDTQGHDYTDGVVFENIEDLKRFWLNVYKSNFRLIYRPFNEVEEFPEICELVYMCGNMTLVAEEIDLFCRPNATPVEVRTILKRGRHKDIKFVGVTQRPFGIDRTVTAMATEAYVFKTDEPRDIDYLVDRFGLGIKDKLQQLQQYEYVHIADHSSELIVGKDEL